MKAIVEEGNQQNKGDKRAKIAIVQKMTQAVRDLSQKDCQREMVNAIKALSLDLVTFRKTSLNNRLEIKLDRKEHALLAVELFMTSDKAAGLIVL